MHAHEHHHPNEKKIIGSIVLNAFITIAEFVGGLMSNSLALLSDALHNLSDTLAILFSLIALKISRKEANDRKTFGYKRVEILAAFINSTVLIVICVYLLFEAYKRFVDPQLIAPKLMLVVATIGFVSNLISILLLHHDSHHNLNVKAAYLHLLGDTFSSVGVIVGAACIYFFKWYWIDPLLTVIISLVIIRHTWTVLLETVEILMQAAPSEIDLELIKQDIEKLVPVQNIHHVHLWRLSDSKVHFECHVDLDKDVNLSECDKIRLDIENLLLAKFEINHVTIQMEYNCCSCKKMISHL